MLRRRATRAALAATLILTTALGAATAQAAHLSIFGLTTDNRLLQFNPGSPSDLILNVKISGLRSGETLIGIDKRPADGMLYSVGKLGTSGWLYTIDITTGAATFVSALVQAGTTTPVALDGSEFGFDFNPAADALRIISDTGQNLRALPSDRVVMGVQRLTGDTFADGTLNYAGSTATGVTAAAYTNNDTDTTTGTTLYDIDAAMGDLVVQNPPNAGTLTTPVGLGEDTTSFVGFDIRTIDGANTAYASLTRQAGRGTTLASLFIIDLAAGAVTDLGKIGGPKILRDIAAA